MQAAAASTIAFNAGVSVNGSLIMPSPFEDHTSQKEHNSDPVEAGMSNTGHAPLKSPTHRFVTYVITNLFSNLLPLYLVPQCIKKEFKYLTLLLKHLIEYERAN